MAKCAACGRFITAASGATCSNIICAKKYHLACLMLPESTQVSSYWKCPDCKKKVPKGDNSATPVKDLCSNDVAVPQLSCDKEVISPNGEHHHKSTRSSDEDISRETQLTLREEIKLFRSELREVRDELREYRREVAELGTSHGNHTQRVDALETRIEALEKREKDTVPDNVLSHLQLTVTRLQLELNDRDQELLSSDLEISNLPEVAGENVIHTVGLIAAKLGVTLEERDIVFAQRVGPRPDREPAVGAIRVKQAPVAIDAQARGRRIILRLTRRALRDNLLQGARTRRGANTADLGFAAPVRKFFINERLTKTNRILFYRVREAAKRLEWRYTWTKSGRILAKQADGKPTHCIRTEEDLARVFGSEAATNKND